MKRHLEWIGWALAGGFVVLSIVCVLFRLQPKLGIGEQLRGQAQLRALVDPLRAALAQAGEAEKSAVLAPGDDESVAYAAQTREATARVEKCRLAMAAILVDAGTDAEKSALASFSSRFAQLRHIDDELLTLAVENTNVKASALAIGAGADAARAVDESLARVIAASATSTNARAKDTLHEAALAQSAVLRLYALVFPHIAEASDTKMDALEARMAEQDRLARAALHALEPLHDANIAAATTSYDRFADIKTRILALSRKNTNVRSLALSLDGKRKATLACVDALETLSHAIDDASVVSTRPRR